MTVLHEVGMSETMKIPEPSALRIKIVEGGISPTPTWRQEMIQQKYISQDDHALHGGSFGVGVCITLLLGGLGFALGRFVRVGGDKP